MKKIMLSLSFFLCIHLAIGQSKGDSLRNAGALEAAFMAYGGEFYQNPTNKEVAYKLAQTLSLSNLVDTAFFFLDVALEDNYKLMPLADSDLYNLFTDPRWREVEDKQFRKFQEKNGELKKPEYARQLIRMIMKDQALDYHLDMGRNEYAKNKYAPHWFFTITKTKARLNAENFTKMNELLEKYGWPLYDDVGELAADAPLLVINHHESEEIRKQYLDQIKAACMAKQGSCMEYAKIHDRILVNTNQPQTYGMQFRFNQKGDLEPFPIKDPETVDKRRLAIGLEPLAVYLKRKINYDWTVKQK
ncbi:DUF6624 domain-containing protein [Roseivirga misakiensis]|uniref:Uncharacterized protein n=1 Tax=Roseivirga misakiensis TaxID=1563681 RepID=A0A1E5SXW7_9BACT|nr:DUF6624 domain-containing protein [Roseivirga misakiensis]OEK03973.1 hypothetical protein BFP71_10770 [Roseivirga misakiensis]